MAAAEPSHLYPRLTGFAGRCPPEDDGGVPGYENFLDILADPATQSTRKLGFSNEQASMRSPCSSIGFGSG